MKKLYLLLLLLMMSACVTPLMPDCTRFGRDGQVCLLPPAALPKLDATHIVTVTRDGKPDSFLGQLHIDDQALRLAGSSLFGTDLFTLSYDGKTLKAEPDSPQLHADTLVVMLELALADPAEIKPRLHGLDMTVSSTATGEVRDISERGHPIVHIERSAGPLAQATLTMVIPPLQVSVTMRPVPPESGAP
ncbi:MAG TPA: DUF3261 domain-containing protein [Gammaproteobacteria bacterium]|nr:DUF3261 domain-containing protein [Gammaproteobacteria bacterium]